MLGFAFFIAMYLVGNALSSQFSLPIPGSIIGLALVFGFLLLRGKVDAPLKVAADQMLPNLALLLVPIGVGVVKLIDPAPAGLSSLLAVLIAALLLGGLLTAKLTQAVLAWHRSAKLAHVLAKKSAHQSVLADRV